MSYTREDFLKDVSRFVDGEVLAKGAVVGVLEKACGDKTNRYIISKYLTGKSSSKDWTEAQWFAMNELVKPFKPEGGKWQSARTDLSQILTELLRNALLEQGQAELPF